MSLDISSVTRSKEQARSNYNKMSKWYDFIAGSSEAKYRQLGLQILQLKPGESVLEIGFGTGHSLVEISKTIGPDGFVVGIDISDGMVEKTFQRINMVETKNNTVLCQADGARLPFPNKILDGIFMSFTLELFDTPEIHAVLTQCRRVLRTYGRIGIVSLIKTENPGLSEQIYEWFHKKMPVLVDCRPILAQKVLENAGFSIKEIRNDSMWGLPLQIICAAKN